MIHLILQEIKSKLPLIPRFTVEDWDISKLKKEEDKWRVFLRQQTPSGRADVFNDIADIQAEVNKIEVMLSSTPIVEIEFHKDKLYKITFGG